MRRTKIICTMGPATDNEDVLRDLMLNGMDVARLNFSHGSHEESIELKRSEMNLTFLLQFCLTQKAPKFV